MEFDYDRYRVDQVIRPIANLYRVTPLAVGDTPAGPPVAYVRQKKLKIKEEIHFFADENETNEIFRIKARSAFDTGSARYDVLVGEQKIGLLWHKFTASLLRTTWHLGGPTDEEVAIARERSRVGALARRVIDFIPGGELVPIRYNFEILVDDAVVGHLDRTWGVRDVYFLDLTGDADKRIDRRVAIALAIGLDTLQNR